MNATQLQVGKTYVVELSDCCIIGGFTSKLLSIEVDEDCKTKGYDSYSGATLTFENGVYLDTFGGCSFDEVTQE